MLCCDRDPFAAHRHQMRSLFGSFGMDPFPLTPQIQHPRTRIQVPVRATKTGPGLNILSENDHVNMLTISLMLIWHLWRQFVSIVLLGVMGDFRFVLKMKVSIFFLSSTLYSHKLEPWPPSAWWEWYDTVPCSPFLPVQWSSLIWWVTEMVQYHK